MAVECAVGDIGVTPKLINDLVACMNAPRHAHQPMQQLEFRRGQGDGLVINRAIMRGHIQTQPPP